MWTRQWLDIDFLKICAKHTSGSVGAMASFKVTAFVADLFVEQAWIKTAVHTIEGLTLLGLLLWLAYQLGVLLWERRVGDGKVDLVLLVA